MIYAVVYRDGEEGKLVRESGFNFDQAEKRKSVLDKKFVGVQLHRMKGVASFKVK